MRTGGVLVGVAAGVPLLLAVLEGEAVLEPASCFVKQGEKKTSAGI